MSLSVVYVSDGIYSIQDTKYGWDLCSISMSKEAQKELNNFETTLLLERLADAAGARLRELRSADD